MRDQPDSPTNTVEGSLQRAHAEAGRASDIIDTIWSDLTGDGQSEAACSPPYCGVVWSADNLASRMGVIADRLEAVRARIAMPKVVPMTQTQMASQSNYASGSKLGY